jgi:hypothetical protein
MVDPIVNPRAGGAQGTGFYGLTGDAATLAQLNMQVYALKQTLKANSPGSKKYKDAFSTLQTAQAQIDKIKAKQTAAKNKTTATKAAEAKKKALEDLQRAKDFGTPAEVKAAQAKADAIKAPASTSSTTPTTTKPTGSTILDANKNGIPDNIEAADAATAAAKTKADAAAKAIADKAAAAKAIADQAVKDKELALKTMYVDYLRATFAGLENKEQKAQIDKLFAAAATEGWTAEQFQMQLEGTSWWQTTLPSLRSWYLNTHDPRKQSTTVELIRNKVASVSSYLEQLGITPQGIDPITGKAFDKTGYVSGIAQEAVKNGWDDNQLRDYLAGQAAIVFTGGGEIGSSLSKIRDTAYAYGVKLDPTYEKMINNSLLDSSDGRDAAYYIAEMRRQAIENPNNKAFSEALNSGRTLYEATRSYRGQMAGLLEVDESNVTWDDLMKKTVDNTTGAARTFADFTKEVKGDPLWQQTRNAKETYSSKALDLAKMFGLVG